MMKLLLVPALLLAACGDNLHPDEDQVAAGAEEDTDDGPTTPGKQFGAGFIYEPADCADHSVLLEGHYGYSDGTPLENAVCRFEFSDGTAVDRCFAVHSFPTYQNVVFTVTDPVTGAVARHEEAVIGPASFDATLDVSTSGLSISWEAHSNYGGVVDPGSGGFQVSISPSENVLVDNPDVLRQGTGTVNVTAAGTYTVSLNAFIRFAEVGGCGAFVDKTIEVTCNDAHAE